ncbi:uncharacterized protein LOC105447334 [Strongylocentrotus purpuratus]|uniref:Uncharacterized protein n=1 Tax=Strongylocentrotus purpuratus TaxID=7668 RepID=A0A7M7LWQ4_STRPU|nr:uncharacterized protein LOC105447334 [Strongylocentrotus purpuratus]
MMMMEATEVTEVTEATEEAVVPMAVMVSAMSEEAVVPMVGMLDVMDLTKPLLLKIDRAVFLVRFVLPAHRSSLELNPSVGLMAPALAIFVSLEARHARQKTTPSNMSAMGTVPEAF